MYKTNHTKQVLIAAVLVSAVSLISCRDYQQLTKAPSIDPTGLVRDVQVAQTDSSLQSIPWRSYFPDTKLQALIAEGLEHNYSMQTALSSIAQAEANLKLSRNAMTPSVSAAAMIDHKRLSTGSEVFSKYTNVNTLGLTMSWEADIWGKLNSQSKAKYASYLNTLESRKLIQTTLISNIATYYYNLEALDEQLKTTLENIVIQQKTVETMQALKDAGQTTGAAVEQSKAQLYSTQLSVFALENQIHQAENSICLLLGRPAGSIDRNSIAQQSIPELMNGNIGVRALANRPDVKQAELTLQSAYATTDAAKAAFYPTFSISSLSVGYAAGSFANFFSLSHLATEVVANLSQPIWAKGQLKANLKISEETQKQALLNFSNTMLTAGKEVSDIMFSYQSSVKKNEWRSKQLESLLKSVDFTQELLKAGEATYTEVLTAQQSLLNAQLAKTTDKLEQLTQSVNLYRALGGGLK
ncbi:MAG: hypothetical protein RIS29_2882 [Bacteroidota bacterium]|jgi:NodT family efflux transporter outer membrane factor (OMF) lipoprotein